MVDDSTFGQIAAANALSDIYAMGGEVKDSAEYCLLPEKMDLNILGEIARGGSREGHRSRWHWPEVILSQTAM